MKNKYKYFFIPVSILLIIACDQASKLFLIKYLKTVPGFKLSLLPFLDIVFSWNYGASFGMLGDYYQYSNKAFLLVNSIIALYLIYLLFKAQHKIEIAAFICVIGGAFGNIIDRILHGAVFDFIKIYYHEHYFPVFNIADSFISIGAFLILLSLTYGKNSSLDSNKEG